MKNPWQLLSVLMALLLFAAACGGEAAEDAEPEPDTAPPAEETEPAAEDTPTATAPGTGTETSPEPAATAAAGEGCGEDGEAPVIRLQGLASGVGPLVLRAIEDNELDQKHGFEGDYLYISPDAALQTFLQRESDVSFDLDPIGAAIARNAGNMVTVFQPILANNASVTVSDDSSYQAPEDLVGERVGHFGTDSGTTSIMAALLGQQGIDVFNDYQLVETGPAALVELLGAGEVEAIFNFTPHTERALVEANGRVLFLAADPASGYVPGLVYTAAYEDWLQDNEQCAYAVQAAAIEAIQLFEDSEYELLREEPYRSLLDVEDEVLDAIVERANEIPLMISEWDSDLASQAEDFVVRMAEEQILIDEVPEPGFATTLDDFYAQ